MTVKIRLRRQGCTNNIVYRVVVADSRAPRDGKCIENIGWYNPKAKNEQEECLIQPDRLTHWLQHGAQLTETVEALVKKVSPEILLNHKQQKSSKRPAKKAAK